MGKSDSNHTREDLASFFANNPDAIYDEKDNGTIACPWDDTTLELRVPKSDTSLVAALNAVHLPPRFTALWHEDSKDLEVIWGPTPSADQIRSRSFDFVFNDETVHCEFGDASERLVLIADSARFVEPPSPTGYRNLQSFELFRLMRSEYASEGTADSYLLTSFWIRGIEWDENSVVDLARNLNFYMHYFDKEAPLIEIHDNSSSGHAQSTLKRYPHGPFPSRITGRTLDTYLLGLWRNSLHGSPRLRFLYCYQILEYAAFYHVKYDILQAIRRVVLAPDTSVRLEEAVRQISDAMAGDRMTEDAKINYITQQLADPDLLWKEIEPNLAHFSSEARFDGGFTLPALVRPQCGIDEFRSVWHPKFIDTVRKIRNALVHGREQRMSSVISPTSRNDDLLRPWLAPISATALQAVLYWDM